MGEGAWGPRAERIERVMFAIVGKGETIDRNFSLRSRGLESWLMLSNTSMRKKERKTKGKRKREEEK